MTNILGWAHLRADRSDQTKTAAPTGASASVAINSKGLGRSGPSASESVIGRADVPCNSIPTITGTVIRTGAAVCRRRAGIAPATAAMTKTNQAIRYTQKAVIRNCSIDTLSHISEGQAKTTDGLRRSRTGSEAGANDRLLSEAAEH